MSIQPQTCYSTATITAGTYESYRVDLTPENDPSPSGKFWALQFGFSGGDGGYFGLQTLGSGLPGKCVVFSVANAISGSGTGIVTSDFDGGAGVSTRKTYAWLPNRTYRFAMTRGTDDGTGRLWTVTVTDQTTSTATTVATIKVPSAWGALTNSTIAFTEHYSPLVNACGDVAYASARWETLNATPLGGGSPVNASSFSNSFDGTSPCTESAITALAAGVRQQMGNQGLTSTSLTAALYDAANSTKVADLTESFDRRFRDPLSDVGTGQLSVLADDTNASNLTIGKVVRCSIGGTTAFSWRIDKRELKAVDRGEESTQAVTLSGRGLVADWGEAVVYPLGGIDARPQSDSRPFTWATSLVSTSAWSSASQQFPNACIPNIYDLTNGWPPLGWPAPVLSSSVKWIWSRAFATHPAGYSLFRKSFTLASGKQCALFLSGGGRARAFVDGIEAVPWTSSYPQWSSGFTTSRTFNITAGTHELAIEGENFDYSGTQYVTPGSVGCVIAALHEVPTSGAFSSSSLIVGTDTTWKTQDYPNPYPSPTPGAILNQLVTEAQARGALSGWSFGGSFSSSVDSAGNAWSSSQECSFRVGDSLLSVLRQMVDQDLIDFRPSATGKVLFVYNNGANTGSSGVTLAAGSNLLELTHTSEAV